MRRDRALNGRRGFAGTVVVHGRENENEKKTRTREGYFSIPTSLRMNA